MVKPHALSASEVMIHRAMPGQYDRCMAILEETKTTNPFSRWLGAKGRQRQAFHRYLLNRGFLAGGVAVALPPVGICVVSRVSWRWRLRLLWARVRLMTALSREQRKALQRLEKAIASHVEAGSLLVDIVAVHPQLAKENVGLRLLRCALPSGGYPPVFMYGSRSVLPSELTENGPVATEMHLPGDEGDVALYKLDLDDILRREQSE